MGVNLGDEVGYTIRFEDHTTSVRLFLSHSCAFFWLTFGLMMRTNCFALLQQGVTSVKFLTDGVLIREMMEDPLLTKYR